VLESCATTANGYIFVRFGDHEGYIEKSRLALY